MQYKKIANTEGIYVTSDGRVGAYYNGKFMAYAARLNNKGYDRALFKVGGKLREHLVHRLVATYFVDNPHPRKYKLVNHLDSDKLNNAASNLEWCNQKMNMQHASKAGRLKNNGRKSILSDELKSKIKDEYTGEFGEITALSRKYNVSVSLIQRLVRDSLKKFHA